MMTHMCVEEAIRAGSDLGFKCTLVQDAIGTKALKFKEQEVSAENIHLCTLSTLSDTYAKVL